MQESGIVLDLLKASPGIAGMAYVAYLSYRRSNEAEQHIQAITDKFMKHIEQKDKQLIELVNTCRDLHE